MWKITHLTFQLIPCVNCWPEPWAPAFCSRVTRGAFSYFSLQAILFHHMLFLLHKFYFKTFNKPAKLIYTAFFLQCVGELVSQQCVCWALSWGALPAEWRTPAHTWVIVLLIRSSTSAFNAGCRWKEQIAVVPLLWGFLCPACGFIHYWGQIHFMPPLLAACSLPTLFRMSARIALLQRNKRPVRKIKQINYLQCLIIIVQVY